MTPPTPHARARAALARLAIGAIAASSVLASAHCDGPFDGPYPCIQGLASCTTADACETSLATDSENCGACGKTCSPGATCSGGTCGPAARVLVTLPGGGASAGSAQSVPIATNGSVVVWSTGAGGIQAASTSGGPTVTLFSSCAAGAGNCGSELPFAIDSVFVYYYAMNDGGAGTTGGAPFVPGFYKKSMASKATAGATFVAALPPAVSTPVWLGVGAQSLYFLTTPSGGPSGNNDTTLWSVPVGGGAPTSVGSLSNADAYVLGPNALYFVMCNGPCIGASIPLTGGGVTTLASPPQSGGVQSLALDWTNLYTIGSNMDCSDGGPGGMVSTVVARLPLDGSPPSVVASTSLTGEPASAAAVDATNVYWVTRSTLWAAPVIGGIPVALAGNLDSGSANLSACSFGGPGSANSIAVDSVNVYVSDPFTGVVYEIPK